MSPFILRSAALTLLLYVSLASASWGAEIAPSFTWVMSAKMNASECAVDDLGNSYITGQAGGSRPLILGTNTIEGGDIFVAKCDRLGKVSWVFRDGGDVAAMGWRIGLDEARNVYVFGQFGSYPPSFSFAGTTLSCALAIGKYTTDGVGLWATPIAQLVTNHPTAFAAGLAVHPQGVYCTAVFHGTVNFGGTNLTGRTDSSPYDDYALVKVDLNGQVEWVRQVKGSGAALQLGLPVVDPQGNVLVAGSFAVGADFGSTNLSVAAGNMAFLAKYNARGDLIRITEIGHGPYLAGWNGALDADGNCYIATIFRETATFGNTTFTNRVGAYYNAFVKCDPEGQVLWARQTSEGVNSRVVVDPTGYVYIADETSSHLTQYSKYDSSGALLWARSGPYHLVHALRVDPLGGCYLLGPVYATNADFDGLTPPNTIQPFEDQILAKLSSTIPPRLDIQITAPALTISWSALADNYHLESTADLSSASSWSRSSLPISVVGAKNLAVTDLPPTALFFRLSRN